MDPAVTLTAEDRRAVASTIDREAERLNRMVRNLLDLSRIEGGDLRPNLEPYEVEALIQPIMQRLASRDGRRIELEIEPALPLVLADAALLDEALSNLVENALVHAGRDARLRIRAERAKNGEVRVSVEDDGPGVPESDLGDLFDRSAGLRRTGDASRRGLGLGLSVVRGFAESMGGTVRARRSVLGGLAVDLSLPTVPGVPNGAPD